MSAINSNSKTESKITKYHNPQVENFQENLKHGAHFEISNLDVYIEGLMHYLKHIQSHGRTKSKKWIAFCCWTFFTREKGEKFPHTHKISAKLFFDDFKNEPKATFMKAAIENNWQRNGKFFALKFNYPHMKKENFQHLGLYHGSNHIGCLGIFAKDEKDSWTIEEEKKREKKKLEFNEKLISQKENLLTKKLPDDFFGSDLPALKSLPKILKKGNEYIRED